MNALLQFKIIAFFRVKYNSLLRLLQTRPGEKGPLMTPKIIPERQELSLQVSFFMCYQVCTIVYSTNESSHVSSFILYLLPKSLFYLLNFTAMVFVEMFSLHTSKTLNIVL